MVARVSFGVQCLQTPPIQLEPRLVLGDQNPRLVDRHDVTVHFAGPLFAVHADRAGNQSFGVDHVRRTAWVQHTTGIWQVLHKQPRPTRMIEVNVRQEHVVDVRDVETLLPKGVEQQWYGIVGAGINERPTAALDNQVARVLERTQVFRVDGDDAIVECRRVRVLIQAASSRGRRGARSSVPATRRPRRQLASPAPT